MPIQYKFRYIIPDLVKEPLLAQKITVPNKSIKPSPLLDPIFEKDILIGWESNCYLNEIEFRDHKIICQKIYFYLMMEAAKCQILS
jgi:hypothetical protein